MAGKQSEVSSHLHHNAAQIRRYLEFVPSFIGPGAPPSEPMGKKHKGTSRVPATDKAHDFWFETCNREAAAILNPRIAELRNTRAAWRGVYFSTLITELYQDPTSVPRWERKETGEDGKRLAAFGKMCRLLADSVAAEYPERQLTVKIPKRSEQVSSRREAADKDRTIDAQDSYRGIVSGLEYLKLEGYSREDAKRKLARDLMCSVPRIEKAITFVNRERGQREEAS